MWFRHRWELNSRQASMEITPPDKGFVIVFSRSCDPKTCARWHSQVQEHTSHYAVRKYALLKDPAWWVSCINQHIMGLCTLTLPSEERSMVDRFSESNWQEMKRHYFTSPSFLTLKRMHHHCIVHRYWVVEWVVLSRWYCLPNKNNERIISTIFTNGW